jgi:hypothetical protein
LLRKLLLGSIFQGLQDLLDEDRLCSLVGRRLNGIADLEKHRRVIVVPVAMPGARARQTLLVVIDPDRIFTRHVIDVVDLRDDRTVRSNKVMKGRLQCLQGSILFMNEEDPAPHREPVGELVAVMNRRACRY